jgi:hypothetical protein
MPPLPAKVNRGITSEQEKEVKSKIKFALPFMVPHLLYKYHEHEQNLMI